MNYWQIENYIRKLLKKKVIRNRIESDLKIYRKLDEEVECMVGLSKREEHILELLQSGEEVSVTELSRRLGVSTVTIRTDLKGLSSKGLILKTHGSAVPTYHPLLMEKQSCNVAAKEAIAKAAASLVKDGDRIMITNGTTSALIARSIGEARHPGGDQFHLAYSICQSECEYLHDDGGRGVPTVG